LLKETTGAFDGARTHDFRCATQYAPRRPLNCVKLK